MAKVTIYTSSYCPYCMRAKQLLTEKNAEFEEICVDDNPELRADMKQKAGGKNSVPQIWINDQHIGGCDDLYALDQAGKLEPLLAQ